MSYEDIVFGPIDGGSFGATSGSGPSPAEIALGIGQQGTNLAVALINAAGNANAQQAYLDAMSTIQQQPSSPQPDYQQEQAFQELQRRQAAQDAELRRLNAEKNSGLSPAVMVGGALAALAALMVTVVAFARR